MSQCVRPTPPPLSPSLPGSYLVSSYQSLLVTLDMLNAQIDNAKLLQTVAIKVALRFLCCASLSHSPPTPRSLAVLQHAARATLPRPEHPGDGRVCGCFSRNGDARRAQPVPEVCVVFGGTCTSESPTNYRQPMPQFLPSNFLENIFARLTAESSWADASEAEVGFAFS